MQMMHQDRKENTAATQFVSILENLELQGAIANVTTELSVAQIGESHVPLTINETEYQNSYVCSPYTAYVSYAKDELGLLKSKALQKSLGVAISGLSGLFKLAEINHTVSINNWLVSTNLPPLWQAEEMEQAKHSLIKQYPQHSLSIRSLNETHHADLMDTLKQQGWYLMPARQVYLFDNEQKLWWKRNHTKKDQSLLRKVEAGKLPLDWVKPADLLATDFEEMANCFKQLFIDKHSHYNPQFSAEFFQALHEQDMVEFHSFRHQETGKIVATIGLFTQQDTITTPIVGYDTAQPRELGLYRLLMAVLLRLTYERNEKMNLSSGAGGFKRARGGEPVVEYTAFYTKHLSPTRNTIHRIFAATANKFGPKILADNEI